jgi:hypothetical protein
LHLRLRRSTKHEEPEQKKDVAEEKKRDAAKKQRNHRETPLARDGSFSWNWPDFMPYM